MLGGSIFSRAAVAAGKRQLETAAAAKAERQLAATRAADAGEYAMLVECGRCGMCGARLSLCCVFPFEPELSLLHINATRVLC